MDKDTFRQSEKFSVALVLDNVRSLHNVGAAFRTSDAFRLECLYLCGITGTPPNRELHKTALGAEDTVQWKHYETTVEAVQSLKNSGYTIIALEQAEGATNLQDMNYTTLSKIAFVAGNEVYGVDDNVLELCDYCVEIPQFGSKHSFNVSVSMGIVLWDFFSKTLLSSK